MALITKPFTFSNGALVIASEHNSNFDTIYTDYNGGITNANIAAGAAIALTKLATVPAASGANSDITSLTGLTTPLGAAYGGTGVANNSAMTVTGSGNFAFTRTLSGTTNVTFPTSGTLLASGGALGTPSSGTGTNITGIPAANILAGSFGSGAYVISTSLQAATIELSHASQNTLSASSGILSIEGVAIPTISSSDSLSNKTLTSVVLGTPTSGTLTNCTGLPAASVLAGTLGSGTFTATRVNNPNNAIAASSNAATVPITSTLNTVTNSSAATLTITMTTTSAVDGQMTIVRILDSSAAAQTVAWVNTENSTVTAPTTSNGSTTLFLTAGFIYNGGTSKWRCIASA